MYERLDFLVYEIVTTQEDAKMKNGLGHLVAFLLVSVPFVGQAQATELETLEKELDVNPIESCQEAIQYYQEGDLKAALGSVDICKDEMEQMDQHMAASSFKDEVAGFQGGEVRQQNAMGFTQIERIYTNGEKKIEVALTGGQSAGMMQMAIAVSGRKTRIGKHSGFVLNQGNENVIYVPVEDAALMFKSKNVKSKSMKKFAKEFMKDFAP